MFRVLLRTESFFEQANERVGFHKQIAPKRRQMMLNQDP